MKQKELDVWYKDNEIPLDDFMRSKGMVWNRLAYEKKLLLYHEFVAEQEKDLKRQREVARLYHRQPEVIDYFKRNKLNHESGDYRALWKRIFYRICIVFSDDYRFLCQFNNLHTTRRKKL